VRDISVQHCFEGRCAGWVLPAQPALGRRGNKPVYSARSVRIGRFGPRRSGEGGLQRLERKQHGTAGSWL